MQTTGYQIREALKQWELRKTAATQEFSDSLFKFEHEEKDTPAKVAERILQAETAITKLQVAQMRYNLHVTVKVDVLGEMTLAEAIKLAGSADRIQKIWQGTSVSPRRNRYDSSPILVRDPNQLHAMSTVTPAEILDRTRTATKRSSALRTAIATGNAVSANIEHLDPALFE